MGKDFSRDTFLEELKSILQEMPEDYYEEKTVAQAVALVIKKADITDLLLKELDAQHPFSLKQLYTAKPKKVVAYYPYETKSIRGESNEIRRFKDGARAKMRAKTRPTKAAAAVTEGLSF